LYCKACGVSVGAFDRVWMVWEVMWEAVSVVTGVVMKGEL
jgi:hypothetical protein